MSLFVPAVPAAPAAPASQEENRQTVEAAWGFVRRCLDVKKSQSTSKHWVSVGVKFEDWNQSYSRSC